MDIEQMPAKEIELTRISLTLSDYNLGFGLARRVAVLGSE